MKFVCEKQLPSKKILQPIRHDRHTDCVYESDFRINIKTGTFINLSDCESITLNNYHETHAIHPPKFGGTKF